MSESEESRVRQQKKLRGPISIYQEYRAKKQLEREKLLLRREEQMKEDLENFLMEIEERKSWNAYELKVANFSRMKKQAVVNKIAKDQSRKDDAEKRDLLLETGLSYFKGDIKAYRRWQNSSAKHLDIKGHKGVVYSCRLSKCLRFIFSCSEDKTAKLWELSNGECVRVYSGHTKKLNDCDIHPNFKINSKEACLVTCSGDTTLKLWNSYDGNCTVTMKGHTQAVYRCSFAPDGNTIVSCSEDRTIRTWCFPEGFQLYIYRGHTSPVTTVNFSPTGRCP